jgi:hypothetical protein
MEREWKNLLEKLEELPFGLEGFTSPTHYVKLGVGGGERKS